MANCVINKEKIKSSITEQVKLKLTESGLFIEATPNTVTIVGEFNSAHKSIIDSINSEYQDNIISVSTEGLEIRKEEITSLFKDIPDLGVVGTENQYSMYLDSIFPETSRKEVFKHRSSKKTPTSDFLFPENGVVYFSLIDLPLFGSKLTRAILDVKNTAYLGNSILRISPEMKQVYKNAGFDSGSARSLEEETDPMIGVDHFIATNPQATTEEIQTFLYKYEKGKLGVIQQRVFDNLQLDNSYKNRNIAQKFLSTLKNLLKAYQVGKKSVPSKIEEDFEFVVFEPNQIHVLGSDRDIKNFETFIKKGNTKSSEFLIDPSIELVEAYESKLAPEIAAQTSQITNGPEQVANPNGMLRITDFLNKVGVAVQSLSEITMNGQRLNADGVALPLQSLILHVNDKGNQVIPEEAMHIGVELLSQKNPDLYNEMLKQIVNFPIYGRTFREYSGIKEYQKDGKPDINKIKKEAIGKLMTEVFLGSESNATAKTFWQKLKAWLKSFFSPMNAEMSSFKESVDSILDDDLGTVRDTLLQSPEYLYEQGFNEEEVNRIMNMAKSMMTDMELSIAIADLTPRLVYMKATPTVERRAKAVKEKELQITEEAGITKFNGKAVKETDLTISLRKLSESLNKTNPLYKSIEDEITNNSTSESHIAVQDVLSKYLDSEGFPKETPVDSLISGKSKEYETVARAVLDKINSFPAGTKFLTNVRVADANAAATIDLLAIDPNETFHIINYQQVQLKEGVKPDTAMVKALQAKLQTARTILSKGYQVSNFGETRTMLVNIKAGSTGNQTKASMSKTAAMDYLAPIPALSETLGSNILDSIYQQVYNIDDKRRVITGTKTERELKNNKTLSGLMSAFRALQISRTVSPLASQISLLSDSIDSLLERYDSEIKDKGINYTSPAIKQMIEDMATYLTIAESLKEIQTGVADINAISPGTIEKYEIAQLGRATRELNQSFSDLNQQIKNVVDSYIAKPNGIRDINEPELVQTWLSREFRSASMQSQATIQLLQKIASQGQSRAELRQNEFLKRLEKVKGRYTKYMTSKGLKTNQALDPITQKTKDNKYIHKLVEKVSRDFYDQAKTALQNNDIEWAKANIDLKAYQSWFETQKEEQFSFIEANTFAREDEDIKDVISRYKEEWLDRFDLSRGLSENNTRIYSYPLESKFQSDEYKKLLTKGNEPALELYNLIVEMNQNAIDSGVLDQHIGKTFIPFKNKAGWDTVVFGNGVSKNMDLREMFKTNEEYVDYGEFSPMTKETKRIPFNMVQDIAKRHIDEKGEVVVDYSGVSTDVFGLLSAFNYQTEVYRNYSDNDAAAALLRAVEASKPSKATDKVSGNAIEGGGLVENVENLNTFDKMLMATQYGKKYDDVDINGEITVSMNGARKAMNKVFGTNYDTEQPPVKLPFRGVLDATRSFFILKVLGLNPATAIVNYLGTNMQGYIDAGRWFTKASFMKNNFKLFSEKMMGNMTKKEKTTLLGMVDLFIPLVDNENNESKEKGIKLDKLDKLNLGQVLMSMLRFSDRPVQWSIAASMLENSIIENGEIINVREYLAAQEKYVNKFNVPQEEKAKLEREFEIEATNLLNEKGLQKAIKFDQDGYAMIEGIARDSDTVVKMREKIQQISKNATGMGTNNEYRLFNSSVIGRNLFNFYSWAPRLIDKRYQDLRYVSAMDSMEWGRLRTFMNWLNKGIHETGTSLMDVYKVNEQGAESLKQEFQKQVERYEANTGKHYYERGANEEFNRAAAERDFIEMYQRNVKAQLSEFLLLAGLFAGLLTIAYAWPDDEEDGASGLKKYTAKIARKALGEISFFYNPMSVLDITNGKIFPGAAVVKDLMKFSGAVYDQALGDDEQQEKAKPLGRAMKLIPGISQIGPVMAWFNQELANELNYTLPEATVMEPNHGN